MESQMVRGEGFEYRFEIDSVARQSLLKGLDEIALFDQRGSQI